MSSENSDVDRVLGALGASDMTYRSFATEPLLARAGEAAHLAPDEAAAAPDAAEEFPLLAAALPGGLGAVPPRAEEAVAPRPPAASLPAFPPPAPSPAAPLFAAPRHAVPLFAAPHPAAAPAFAPAALPWAAQPAPAPSAPAVPTPLERVFRILRGGAAPPQPGGPAGRGLHDLFRRL
jgi:hypothetical protein